MNKEEIEQRIKCIEVALKSHENGVKVSKEKLSELKEQLENVDKRWKPKYNEHYWYKDSLGRCGNCVCDNPSGYIVIGRFKQGNFFKTEEECLKSIARDEAEAELLDMCDGMDIHLTENYWYIGAFLYNTENKNKLCLKFEGEVNKRVTGATPYRFASYESCQKAIDTLGNEKLKLIFRIED